MHVIGTAGHVDHGKSALVTALTGIQPDRLKEEQQRQMTIDLGYAWMTLPGGEQIGIVDVPGHRDFIENMLAGAGEIDAALLVIAANEGIMPQTREHLAILDALQIRDGVIVLTKVDLLEDLAVLDKIEQTVRSEIADTLLAAWPVVGVSSKTGQGIEKLKQVIADLLANHPPRPDLGKPRLSIDRVFTLSGFGVVVTGTLSDGQLRVGEDVVILPDGIHGRIRGLQSYKQKVDVAQPGSRVAVNLVGVGIEDLQRGDVLIHPGQYGTIQRLDVRFHLAKEAGYDLRHNTVVKLFLNASDTAARIRLLGAETLHPGESGWLQLELASPIVAVCGDRYLLWRPSPGELLGSGEVVVPDPAERHKRFDPTVIQRLESYLSGTPDEMLLQAALTAGTANLAALASAAKMELTVARQVVEKLTSDGRLIALGGEAQTLDKALFLPEQSWKQLVKAVEEIVGQFHREHPLRAGIPKEDLRRQLKATSPVFQAYLQQLKLEQVVKITDTMAALSGFEVHFSPQQQRAIDALRARFAQAPYAPPSVKECQTAVGADTYATLLENGILKQLSAVVVISGAVYQEWLAFIRLHFDQHPTLTVIEFRDAFATSRKYALAFLEYLDAQGLTLREDNFRRLKANNRQIN
jgi:selenocysteine-specific elongation factor